MNVEIVYPEPHEKQQEILDSKKRFNHLQCGRRFGKTELIKELCDPIIYGYPIAIFCPIERDFLKIWDELCSLYRDIIKKKNETYHTIELLTGGTIHMWSMKAVDNGRGEKYKRVILDEFAKAIYGKKSWEETIRATLTDLKGDAWFLSTPKGRKNYFCILKTLNRDNPNWCFHKYTSYDNPYLDKAEIDSAKSYTSDGKLSPAFRQEYLAEDVDANEMPFLYCFDESKHVSNSFNLDESLPLWLSFDFNVMPQTCSLGQRIDNDTIKVRKLIRLDNASIYDMCNHIKLKYRSYYWIVTGDATGKNRSGTAKGNLSYWAIIKKELSLSDLQIKLRSKNLDHTTSQVICNSVLTHKTVVIHEECKELIDDCIFASTDEHGKLIKSPDRGLHFLDNFRYLLDANFPDILKIK